MHWVGGGGVKSKTPQVLCEFICVNVVVFFILISVFENNSMHMTFFFCSRLHLLVFSVTLKKRDICQYPTMCQTVIIINKVFLN